MGIYIDQIKDSNGKTTTRGNIYGVEVGKDSNGNSVYFSSYPVYDWFVADGYNNLGDWVEEAAKAAGR